MPSLRHAVVAHILGREIRRTFADRDADVAQQVMAGRSKEDPLPPAHLRARVRTDDQLGFPVHTYRPEGARGEHHLVYMHGGAYVRELNAKHWRFISRLGDHLAMEVVVPQYPLAPEATWKESRTALHQLATTAGPGRLVLAGESAGGGLALAMAQHATARGVPPAGLLLISPWVDLSLDPVHGVVTDDPWLVPDLVRTAGQLWAGGDDIRLPDLSPLHGAMDGLPPALVFSGTRDICHPSILALVKRMEESGVDVRSVVGDRLIHVYPGLPVPEARAAFTEMLRFFSSLTD